MNEDRILELCKRNKELLAPLETHAHRFNVVLSAMLAVKLDAHDDYKLWLRKLGEIGETIKDIGEDITRFGEFQRDMFDLLLELVREMENDV